MEQVEINSKSDLKKLLQDTDWAMSSDVSIDNSHEFIAYRQYIRDMFLGNSVMSPVVPVPPEPVWTLVEAE